MTKCREILRLTALGLSQRNVMQSINVSQKTVVKVQRRAREMNQIHCIKELNLKSCQNAKNSIEKVATSIKTPLKKLFNSFILSTEQR